MGLLARHFDTAFAAPDGIQKLRELILTLAMQGKLVPQDPNDQPASELLKAITAKKQRLVKEGKIKEQKPLPTIKPEEMPYSLPKQWDWVRLEDIVDISSGVAKGRKLNSKEMIVLPYLRVANVQRGYLDLDVIKDIEIAKDEIERFELKERDLLITEGGDWDKVGRTAIWNAQISQCIHQNHIFKARCLLTEQNEQWLEKYLNSIIARAYFANASKQTTNLASINKTQLRGCPIPLPPLAEQRRIVAKIDQLMARCDELEKLRSDRAQKLITVHTAAIAHLLTAQDSDDFTTAWRFITQHFGELYSVKKTVAELRKTILQLAVMGKLVPQDPNDEPASELLKAIELEKQQLVKEGKIKSSKPLPEISHDQLPHQLPLSWEWVRLGNITTLQNGFAFKSENYISQGIKLIRNVNIGHGSVDHKNIAYYPDSEWEKFKDFELSQGDILISLDRPIISTGLKIAVLKENDVPSLLVQRVGRIEVKFLRVNPSFLFNWFNSSLFMDRIIPGRSNGVPHISTKEVETLLFPLPPLAEQHRIVAKVDQLMALCDRLEEAIETAQAKQTDLLNAVMAQV